MGKIMNQYRTEELDNFENKYKNIKEQVIPIKKAYNDLIDKFIMSFKEKNAKEIHNLKRLSKTDDSIDKDISNIFLNIRLPLIDNQIIGNNKNIVRVMPNTPCLVKKGVFALCKDKFINENTDKDDSIKNKYLFLCDVLNKLGEVIEISEDNFDIATQIGGASPAWLFMIAEAMADGAV